MKKIVLLLAPYLLDQEIYVIQDNVTVETIDTTIDKLSETLFATADKYKTLQVDIIGPKQYSRGIKKQIETKELATYNVNNLQINII